MFTDNFKYLCDTLMKGLALKFTNKTIFNC